MEIMKNAKFRTIASYNRWLCLAIGCLDLRTKTHYILETRSVQRSESAFDSSLRFVATYQKTEGTAQGKRFSANFEKKNSEKNRKGRSPSKRFILRVNYHKIFSVLKMRWKINLRFANTVNIT